MVVALDGVLLSFLLFVCFAVWLFNVARDESYRFGGMSFWGAYTLYLFLLAVFTLTFLFLYIFNAYTPDYTNRGARIIVRTLFGVVGAAVAVLVYSYITRATETDPIYWRGTLLVGYALFLPYACISRVLISKAALKCSRASDGWSDCQYIKPRP